MEENWKKKLRNEGEQEHGFVRVRFNSRGDFATDENCFNYKKVYDKSGKNFV